MKRLMVCMACFVAILTGRTAMGGNGMKQETFYSKSILEEELKNKVAADWFAGFDSTRILSKIDFCIALPPSPLFPDEVDSLLWAEAKKGASADIYASFVQLVLTIGRERTAEKYLPPKFLGAFDAQKIAFLPYGEIMEVFSQNDFNWNVTPSDHETKEFKLLYARVKKTIEGGMLKFDYLSDASELRKFIKANFSSTGGGTNRIRITKNNFTHIYRKWREAVMPTIEIPDWNLAKKNGIIDADFFLADILSQHNLSLTNKLNVLLMEDRYRQANGMNALGQSLFSEIGFNDKQTAHKQFWNRYRRPPKKEYWDFIVNRRDLLVPQDVRERKGSFFTPAKWVELSQEYLRRELGDDWQDEYYVWDCCAGTGNLLAGLVNKYRIWASTLDQADVDVMHERIKMMNESGGGANLLDSHVFQFDFLNDSFDKLPVDLQAIIDDPEKSKRLVIYINPPYAEAGSSGKKKAKKGVSNTTAVHGKILMQIGKYAKRELYAQFLARIYSEISGATIGEFSKLKALSGPYFKQFRSFFEAKLVGGFIVPGDTFDNVKGQFPIGFKIWKTDQKEIFKETSLDVYDRDTNIVGKKKVYSYDDDKPLNDWIRPTWKSQGESAIGYLICNGNDFQHQNEIVIYGKKSNETSTFIKPIFPSNLEKSAIYLSVRKAIKANWLNDRDQFLSPNDGWQDDNEFKTDCLVYALFDNVVKAADGVNHWIPFTEAEVDAKDAFASHFMSDYLAGRAKAGRPEARPSQGELFNPAKSDNECGGAAVSAKPPYRPIDHLSPAAKSVLDAGRELWRYYHEQPGANPNASFYDIRFHFQGVKANSSGKTQMNADSTDSTYTGLLGVLRKAHRTLAEQIAPKIYEYGFLRR